MISLSKSQDMSFSSDSRASFRFVKDSLMSRGTPPFGYATPPNCIKALRNGQRVIFDSISYHSVIVGFPFLTLTIILGAIWADIAWGRPWGWDPKETASLVTWLIFAAYLHARVLRGWRDTRSALLLVIGFLAILFTFFDNFIISGLHSYR